jgi:hypothetical protein
MPRAPHQLPVSSKIGTAVIDWQEIWPSARCSQTSAVSKEDRIGQGRNIDDEVAGHAAQHIAAGISQRALGREEDETAMPVRLPDEVARSLDQVAIALTAFDERAPDHALGRIGGDQHEGRGTADQRQDHGIGTFAGKRAVQPFEARRLRRERPAGGDGDFVDRAVVEIIEKVGARLVGALHLASREDQQGGAVEAGQACLGRRQCFDEFYFWLGHRYHLTGSPSASAAGRAMNSSSA